MAEWQSLQTVTDKLNELLRAELEMRGLHSEAKPNEVPVTSPTQVGLIIQYSTRRNQKRLEELVKDELKDWAKELAVKLARPFPLESFMLELPKAVHEVAMSNNGKTIIRGVTDYSISNPVADDALLTRFDLLVRWVE